MPPEKARTVMLNRMSASVLSLLLVGFPQGTLSSQEDARSITTPCNAHLASISETTPHAYEKHFEWAKTPSAATEFASKPLPNTVELIAVAPVTAQDYRAIFGHGKTATKANITEAQRKELEGVQKTLRADFARDEGDRAFNKADFKRVVQAKTASFVIVIGHNEGGMLRLLDGGVLYLDEIVASARPEQRIILISCDSASRVYNTQVVGTIEREVTYDEAFGIARGIMKFIEETGGPISLSDVQAELAKQGVSTTHEVAFFIMKAVCFGASLIVVALIIRELDPCKDKNSPCPDKGSLPVSNDKKKKDSSNRKGSSPLDSFLSDAPAAQPLNDFELMGGALL
jgi:hypothetical protein